MNQWNDGYVSDIGYSFGYFPEINPLRAQLAVSLAGYQAPAIHHACELGFGQGISLNIHGAASDVQWFGTDFNPAQTHFARALSQGSGAAVQPFDQSFAEFCARDDLPDFDYIALHGVWSWISDQNRQIIADFLRRKLRIGGIVYISYNTQPGWAAFAPLRELLAEFAAVMRPAGERTPSKIEHALDYMDRLLATNPAFSRANPHAANRLKGLRALGKDYLAHEYFNRDWKPMLFSEIAKVLRECKLTYATSAHLLDHVDNLNLSAEQATLLAELQDDGFRETVRDFCVNQQFRRDYWIRGGRKPRSSAQADILRHQSVVLTTPLAEITMKARGALGEGNLSETIFRPMLECLQSHQPRTLGQIEEYLAQHRHNIPFRTILEAVALFVGKGDMAPAHAPDVIEKCTTTAHKLNTFLIHEARHSADVRHLASPVTGAGVLAQRFEKLFLLAHSEGITAPDAVARFAWNLLEIQNGRLTKEGQPVPAGAESIAELERQAQTFFADRLPVLQALKVF